MDPIKKLRSKPHYPFAQELLSTFSTSLGEVALIPTTGGAFTIEIIHASTPVPILSTDGNESPKIQSDAIETHKTQLWDRKTEGGFPDIKQLKKLVRDIIDPSRDLGHVDRHISAKHNLDDDKNHGLGASAQASLQGNLMGFSADKEVKVPAEKTVDIHQTPTTTEIATAETMVAEIMSSFQSRHADVNRPLKEDSTSGVATSVTDKAANLIGGIAESFRQTSPVRDEIGDIGGGSGGLEMGTVQTEESNEFGKDEMADVGESAKKDRNMTEGCEDCG
ncbi:MAG: hypothetical protein Q9202_006042 [Teloschistes flavicans]